MEAGSIAETLSTVLGLPHADILLKSAGGELVNADGSLLSFCDDMVCVYV